MSDFWQSIVVLDSPHSAPRLAEIEISVMSFLWDRDIVARDGVEETPGFPDKKWYASRPNAARCVHTPEKWNWPYCDLDLKMPHGLTIDRRKRPMSYGDCNVEQSISCPECLQWQEDLPWHESPLSDAEHALEDSGSGPLTCPACGKVNDIRYWLGDPPFAVGKLAFEVWNWPKLKSEFLRELSAAAHCELQRVEYLT